MKEFFTSVIERLKPLYEYITRPSIIRKANITYQVIWNYILLFLIVAAIGGAFAGGVAAGYFASMVKDEPIRSEKQLRNSISNYEETSEIYFAGNVHLGKLRTDLERKEIKLADVSENVKNALISTEDQYFFKHNGIVPKAIVRALFQEVTNASVQSGGSTLTQQLIKQQILTNQVSFDRKAKEILLAQRLEKFMTKDEILEAYLNVSPFGRNSSGRNIAGVQAAAEGIFGKQAKDLNIPQAAFIAGLPQNPYAYTPFTQTGEKKEDLTPGLNRMKTVLNRMYSNGAITKEEFDQAIKYDIVKDFIKPQPSSTEKYPYLTYEVEKRAKEIILPILAKQDGYSMKDLEDNKDLYNQYLAMSDQAIRQNGYQIHTTINKQMYDKFQSVTKNFPYYQGSRTVTKKDPETGKQYTTQEPIETGAVLIENSTGKILSFVGGRDFKREQLNHATAAIRSNGSTMKPLLVYAPAMEYGLSYPGKTLVNAPVNIRGYMPKNYEGGGITGLTTAREALKKSYNIPAVMQYLQILDRKPAQFLAKMGISTLVPSDYEVLAASLGGISRGVTVEENTNAYATFANGGQFVDAYLIEKIVDDNGKVVYQHKVERQPVFSPQTAFLTLDMMRDVVNSGTAGGLKSQLKFNADWAGKTGTSQDYKDAWFVGTNPNVTLGVWMGYDSNGSIHSYGMSYSKRNLNLWAQLINSAYDVNPSLIAPAKRHQMPPGIVQRSYCMLSGLLPLDACSKAGLVRTDYFNAKYLPSSQDGNLQTGKGQFVMIGDKKYAALASTPAEFTEAGLVLSENFFDSIGGKYVIDKSTLMPKGDLFKNLMVGGATMNDDGKVPASPATSTSGNQISWKASPNKDVVGYRVYRSTGGAFTKVASIKTTGNFSFKTDGNGIYYVTAVDIAGKESPPSVIIEFKKDESGQKDEDKNKPNKPVPTSPPGPVPPPVPEPETDETELPGGN